MILTVDWVWCIWVFQLALVVTTVSGGLWHHWEYLTCISGAVVGNDDPLVAVNTSEKWWECIVMSWAFNWVVYRFIDLLFGPIILNFITCSSWHTPSSFPPVCVQGFLNEKSVRIAADVYGSIRNHGCQQRIIPGIKFTYTGTLTKWIIGAQRTQTQATNHLQLQIWRRQGSSNRYDRLILVALLYWMLPVTWMCTNTFQTHHCSSLGGFLELYVSCTQKECVT